MAGEKKNRVSFEELSEKEKEWVREVVLSGVQGRPKPAKPGALMDFVLSSAERHEIPKTKLPKELLPYIDRVNRARSRRLYIDGKGVVRETVMMGRALSDMARPPWKSLEGEVQIIHVEKLPYNKPLAYVLGRMKDSGFTHMHVDTRGGLVFEKKKEFAGKVLAPSLRKPHTLLKRARIPF